MNKFKVGDWVRHRVTESVYQITETDISYGVDQFEYWTPKPNEWVWCWNDELVPHLGRFVSFNKHKVYCDMRYGIKAGNGYAEMFKWCEPFLGTLPSVSKEIV